jgi:nicotinate-nucleotide adenylyltransferase
MKIGILGGSFNPVHIGHLLVAEDIIEKLKLDKIIFIPAYDPPHKKNLLNFERRWQMLKMAIAKNPLFELSGIEKQRSGKSFTIDTLRELKKQYPKDKLFFIMGTDQFAELSTWKEPDKLFQLAEIIVMRRPGFELKKYPKRVAAKEKSVTLLDVIQIDIASAEIRYRIKNNLSIRYMLPEPVLHYIIRNRLYLNTK